MRTKRGARESPQRARIAYGTTASGVRACGATVARPSLPRARSAGLADLNVGVLLSEDEWFYSRWRDLRWCVLPEPRGRRATCKCLSGVRFYLVAVEWCRDYGRERCESCENDKVAHCRRWSGGVYQVKLQRKTCQMMLRSSPSAMYMYSTPPTACCASSDSSRWYRPESEAR